MSRFGEYTLKNIENAINANKPVNTTRSEQYIWTQFMEFCKIRQYCLESNTTEDALANMLQDWAYNMRKKDGSEYKENVVKLLWNVTANLLQKKYFAEHNRVIKPFQDIIFEKARNARDSKRKQLQKIPEKRKTSAAPLSIEEIKNIALSYDEDTPDGLQKKFYQLASTELAWRGNEGSACLVDYFQKETGNDGSETGRILYNPIFSKTAQGGSKNLTQNKWLIPNNTEELCPVRLFNKLISKRTANITTNRLFLTPNKYWQNSMWYKNMPVGINEMSKWTRLGAENIGLDTKRKKITNHSNRSSTVSNLSNSGSNLQEIIKITGHTSIQSLEPYLKLNEKHHEKIISNLRNTTNLSNDKNVINYNNCTFNIYNK